MARLLHDRYYACSQDHAWDLATGEAVPLHEVAEASPASAPAAEPLVELLEQGREGEPRWVVMEAAAGRRSRAVTHRAAEEARARGVIPIDAGLYFRLRSLLAEDLRHRTLMIILRPGVPIELGGRALVDAAAGSPRPHVLLSFRVSRTSSGPAPVLVKEARTAYGAVAVRTTSDRVTGSPPTDEVRRLLARSAKWEVLCGLGRHAAAERLLREVAGALVRRNELVPAATTLVTLGRLVLERGRAAAAEAIFGEAATHAVAAGDAPLSVGARVWQAAARTDASQLTGAESLCRAVLLAGALTNDERARAEATLARVLLWQGRVDEAGERDLKVEAGEDDVAVFVGATAVRVLLARGDVFTAGQRAREILSRAAGSQQPVTRVIALSAHARVLMEAGDLVLAAQRLTDVQAAAKAARSPLRLARIRLQWVDTLRRVGRMREAQQELRGLGRLCGAAPPLLRSAIQARLRRAEQAVPRVVVTRVPEGLAARMVAIGRDEEGDREAVRRVLTFACELLRTSRLDVWSADAGPPSLVLSVGSGLATTLGPRVLDSGIGIDTRDGAPGGELGVPVRLGPRLVAALVARWPMDRAAPAGCRELLDLAAAVASPRIEAMRAGAREVANASTAIPELVGSSAAMTEVRRSVARAATAPFSVLIEGESGSGKELVARALHHLSPRRERRFCDLNCAALPDELVESELFGHTRGAFTGAVTDRPGLIEEADGGTLFLDEVADLSPRAQAKLLRVIQQQEVRRVGATFSRKIDVRVVSAANRDIRAEAGEGRFRQDLLYRLDVVRIRVPPLRERPEDIPELASRFWRTASERVGTRAVLTHAVLTALSRYHWPGNVRELQNVMAGLAVAAPSRGHAKPSLLPPAITGAPVLPSARLAEAREQFERRFIQIALARAAGRRAHAARELGLSRQGLLKMMARLGMNNP